MCAQILQMTPTAPELCLYIMLMCLKYDKDPIILCTRNLNILYQYRPGTTQRTLLPWGGFHKELRLVLTRVRTSYSS